MTFNLSLAAWLVGSALALDLSTNTVGHTVGHTAGVVGVDSDVEGKGDSKTEASLDSEWQDANICITYGADNSSTGCGSSCGSCGCGGSLSAYKDEVSYTSPEYEIEGLGSLDTANVDDDLELEGVTAYEILGYGACATVRKIIKMTMVHDTTGSGMSSNDIGTFYVVFVDEDGIANAYTGTYTEADDEFKWERFTKAT